MMRSEKDRYKTLICILVGLIFVLFFFWENFSKPAVNITPSVGTNDLTDLNYPFLYRLSDSYKKGQIAFWVPDLSSGYPLLAGFVGILYPVNILLSIFPTITSLNLTIFISYFLIYLASFIYLRTIKLSRAAAVFASLIFTFGGYNATELLHFEMIVTVYLMLFQLTLLEYFLQKKNLIFLFSMSLLMGLSFIGAHPQTNFYALLFVACYWLIRAIDFKVLKSNIFYLILYAVLALAIGLPQLLPMAEFTLSSTRATGLSQVVIDRMSFPLKNIATLVSPFLFVDKSISLQGFQANGWPADEMYVYIGLIGLILALITFVRYKSWHNFRILYLIFAVGSLIFMLGSQLMFGSLLSIPPFSFFRGSFRMSFVFDFSLAVLAAYGLEDLSGWFKKKNYLYLMLLAFVFVFSIFDLKVQNQVLHPTVGATKWFKEPEIVSFVKAKLSDQERVTVGQYYYPAIKTFLAKNDLWNKPETLINLRNLLPAFDTLLYQIPLNVNAANSATLKIARYNELDSEIYFGGLVYDSNLSNAQITDSSMFLNRLMGVRYFVSGISLTHFNISKVKEIKFSAAGSGQAQDPIYIYELIDYFPRVFMVPKAEKASPDEIKTHLFKGDFDPKKIVYLDSSAISDSDLEKYNAKGGYAGTALFDKYEDQKVKINTQTSGEGYLFLSDNFYPGWKAFVDGKETKIYRANYSFRAVAVPGGKHQVIFEYQPESFYLGMKITVGSILVLILASGLELLKRRFV